MFEKVNPSHPDKVADRLAGAIVDLCYTKSKNPKVACEVLIGHQECNIQVETSERITAEDIEAIVRRIAGEDFVTRALIVPQDANLAANQRQGVRCGDRSATDRETLATEGTQERHHRSEERVYRCGDNGIFKGVPPTHEQKLLTAIAAKIYSHWPKDGKYIIHTDRNDIYGNPIWKATICQSNASQAAIEGTIDYLVDCGTFGDSALITIINPLGPWTGGPNTDSGATNRKLGSDMGDGVTGGGLHGKDLSKCDVSVNIVCFLKAVHSGQVVTAICSIGDENVTFQYASGKTETETFADVVEQARLYILTVGGFEKFSMWGLIRPQAAE